MKAPARDTAARHEASLRRIRNELALLLAAIDDGLQRIDQAKKEGADANV
jgi:hypothetical protein